MTVTFDLGASIRTIGIALSAAAILAFFWLIVGRVRRFFVSRKFSAQDLDSLRRRWKEIEAMAAAPGEMQRKMAVLEADKLLDQALKSLAMAGETLGERLKFAQYRYPALREVWWAHKIRNQLVHEATFHLEVGMARRAVASYRKALGLLGAI